MGLTGMEGDLVQKEGKLSFIEKDGIDYAPTTVQLPGGERVPFLFTVKSLVASSDGPASSIEAGLRLKGNFKVPSYRTGLFLDPKGRGTTTGYDQARSACPASRRRRGVVQGERQEVRRRHGFNRVEGDRRELRAERVRRCLRAQAAVRHRPWLLLWHRR